MSNQYPGMDDPAQAIGQAIALHRRGQVPEAAQIYLNILRNNPGHFDALHYLGLAEAQSGRPEQAEQLLREAIRINPESADAHANRGNIQRDLKRYDDALASYDNALRIKPDYANALNNRGAMLSELGRFDEALESFDRALAIDSSFPGTHYNRSMALRNLGRINEALECYDRCIELDPSFAPAYVDRGNMLIELGRFEEALASYDRAVTLEPRFADAWHNRGVALLRAERWNEALESFDKALALEPQFFAAALNRGNALMQLRRIDEALAAFERSLDLYPDSAVALNSKGNALIDLGQNEEALSSFDRALAIEPGSAGVLTNRANALFRLRRTDEALASIDSALNREPGFADALNMRANILASLGRIDDARASFDQAIEADPALIEAIANRGVAALTAGDLDEARSSFEQLVARDPAFPYALGNLMQIDMHRCDWKMFDTLKSQIETGLREGRRVVQPFNFLNMSDSSADQLRAGRIWVADMPPVAARAAAPRAYAHDRPRVAYLSADYRAKPMSATIPAVFEYHDRARFDLTAVSFGPDDGSAERGRFANALERFIDVRDKTDADIVAQFRDMEIDIIVDLMGFTEYARPGILAARPAGIQVSYIGFPGSMGADFIDYILADSHVVPQGRDGEYSEKIVRLPDAYLPYDTTRRISDRTFTRAEVGLPERGFVFCCFNTSFKISPQMFDRWMRLLKSVDESVLWLIDTNPIARDNLRREAAARGVDPQRLVFAPVMKAEDHLARHRLADLFLDTLPYNAHTTANDALWAGLPVLTCGGDALASRVAGSLLKAIGLPELVTDSLDAYEALALDLARNPGAMSAIKQKLERNGDVFPLFDTKRTTRHIEAAFETMLERHRRGEPAASFSVPAMT